MDGNQAEPSTEASHTTDQSSKIEAIDRREYLKYAGVLAGVPLLANHGVQPVATTGGDAGNREGPIEATNLLVDYTHEPNNVPLTRDEFDDSFEVPQFTWEVAGPRATTQSAYHILVAESQEALDENEGDTWDSGKIESSRSVNVLYEGDPLEPDTTYYWKVRIWDNNGNESDWSEPSQFVMAIPHDDDHWEGEWIGPEYVGDELPGFEWTDYTLDIEFTLVEQAAGFVFRASSEDDLYMWQVTSSELIPHVREGREWMSLEAVDIEDIFEGAGEQSRIEIELDGNEITTRIDGEEVDTRTDDTYSSGTIGFYQRWMWVGEGSHAQIHSVAVTDSDGDMLFEDDFSDPSEENFPQGDLQDGLLNLEHNRISLLGGRTERPEPLLRNQFDLKKPIEGARIHISGLGIYELYCNGERVGDRVLEPGRTDFDETVLYSTYDITNALEEGRNVLGVRLGRNRFGDRAVTDWAWDEVSWWSDPQLRLQLNVEFADGTNTSIATDDSWSMTDGPTRFNSLMKGEVYDAREERASWTTLEYNDADWESPPIVDAPEGELTPQRVQPMKVMRTLEPVDIMEPEEDVYVFDIGQNLAGWSELTVDGPEGTEVTLKHGEKLHDDGTVNIDSPRTIGRIQTDQYVLDGEGTETWESRYSYKGFRYVQVEGFPGTPSLNTIEAKFVHTAINQDDESHFECSNDLLNQIYENTEWGFLSNHHSVPQDTPKLEKNGWTGDAQATAETGMYNFSMERFYQKWLRDLRDAQLESGEVPVFVPTTKYSYEGFSGWPASKGPTPAWDAVYYIVPWLMYRFNDDEQVLRENYETMQSHMEWFQSYFDGHVPDMGLGDHAAPGETELAPFSTAYYYLQLDILAQSADVLGHADDAAEYNKLKNEVRDTFNEEFYNPDVGYYGTDEVDEFVQTTNVLALAFEMVPEDRVDSVVNALVQNIQEEHNGNLNTGVFGTKHILSVLSEYNHHDVAYTVATQTDYPSWGHWIENDMTTLLEFWDLDARSRNHHFFGSIVAWYYKHLAGIQIDEPGFEHIRIAPKPVEDLESASGQVDTIRGVVESNWELVETPGTGRNGQGICLNVTIPGNSTASVEIPTLGGDKVRVREDGKTFWNKGDRARPNHSGIKEVSRNGDRLIVEIRSGEYEFELEQLRGD